MSYENTLIKNILNSYVMNRLNTDHAWQLKIIAVQVLTDKILLEELLDYFLLYQNEVAPKSRACFLIGAEDQAFQALVITRQHWNNDNVRKLHDYINHMPVLNESALQNPEVISYLKGLFQTVNCTYVYPNGSPSEENTLLKIFNDSYHSNSPFSRQPVLFNSIIFTEAIIQLLTDGRLSTIDVTASLKKHHDICVQVTISHIEKWKSRNLYVELIAYLARLSKLSALAAILFKIDLASIDNAKAALKVSYLNRKRAIYIRDLSLAASLSLASYEILFHIISINSCEQLLDYLKQQCAKQQYLLSQRESVIYRKNLKQMIGEHLLIAYQNTIIGLGAEVSNYFTNTIIQAMMEFFKLNKNVNIKQNFILANVLRIMGGCLSIWYIANKGIYTLCKPLLSYYIGNWLASEMQEGRFDDTKAHYYSPRIPYHFDLDKWVLLALLLLSTIEVLYSRDIKILFYTAISTLFGLLLTNLAILHLPEFKQISRSAFTERHFFILLFMSMLGRELGNFLLDYYYQVKLNHAVCKAVIDELDILTANNTVARHDECGPLWAPSFWNAKTLRTTWTDRLHTTYDIDCKISGTEVAGHANCTVEQKITTKLIKP